LIVSLPLPLAVISRSHLLECLPRPRGPYVRARELRIREAAQASPTNVCVVAPGSPLRLIRQRERDLRLEERLAQALITRERAGFRVRVIDERKQDLDRFVELASEDPRLHAAIELGPRKVGREPPPPSATRERGDLRLVTCG